MDPHYNYYHSGHGHESSSGQPSRHGYPRSPDQPSASAGHPYPYQQPPVPTSYHPGPAYPQQHASSYHASPTQQTGTMLPPLAPSHGYSRDVTHSARNDVPSGFAAPSLGPTLHDLPFSAPRASSSSSSQANRTSGHWGNHPLARTPPLYERTATYPPSTRGTGSQHPSLSLSHSTHLIPTPAQTAQTYHAYPPAASSSSSSSSAPAAPVVASIPPATSSSPPQERYFCERCEKSFGRQHDKKRHYESTHLQQMHTCRFCSKTFSRNDSLKRHQDNGCDKDPEFSP
ncbi:hypothetical protein K466DRAFT_597896 [Polyporus arcularius HHB13444]|uniref:C2H2-type domain-containing protein n=1 Tax=Polyporus arcularius HHB13444 TaxID=1314778 RepID=A0A5C3PJQ5_9APHY|nr:hypothetical protein K466DRAFT_597896 [Polyporus arcularius HHB13444]